MNTILNIAKKEFKAYFLTPIAYIYLTTFLVVTHWIFLRSFFLVGQNSLRGFFDLMPWVFLFFVPAAAMGKWAEERKTGTIELLFTFPIKSYEIIVGKFLAGLGLIASALFFTFPLILMTLFLGRVDLGPILGGYIGLLLMGGAYLAIGLWVSSLTENQIIAFILGVAVSFLFLIIGEPLVTTGLSPSLVSFLNYLGLGSHFDSMGRGVMDSRDVLYYFSVIFLFLFFNLKSFEARLRHPIILGVIVFLFSFNLLSSRHFTRLDFTEQKAYTLSNATKKILKNLEDKVVVRLYFSKELPSALIGLKRDVEDILSEFKTHSQNQIQVEFHNPQENAVEEQKVQMMGIPPIEVNIIEKDKQEVAKIYLGATLHFETKQEVLPVIQNTRNLEYRLCDAILKVTQVKKPTLGMWEIEESLKNEYSFLLERLRERFELKTFHASNLTELQTQEIPTFLVIAPSPISNEALQGIESYLHQGGKTLLFLESIRVQFQQGLSASKNENSFEKILGNYGVSIVPNLILDPSNAMATFTGGVVSYHIPYPYWVRIHPDHFNKFDPIVSELQSLVLPWVSALEIKDPLPQGVAATPLFQSTPYAASQAYQENLMSLDPNMAKKIFEENQPKTYPLGVLLTKTNGGKESKMILVGNTQFLRNHFLEQFEENLFFFENALDRFTSGDALIGIRSKGVENYPIAVLNDGKRQIIKAMVIAAPPLLLALVGLWVVFWKRSKAKALQLAFHSPS